MLSGSSTSETHPGHREPCQTYRRLQAESSDKPKECRYEVPEEWKRTDGPRKCENCRKMTSEKARVKRVERRAKTAARKLQIQNKRRRQEFNTFASTTNFEAEEAADNVNNLPPVQAQKPRIHQAIMLPQMQAQEPMIHPDQDNTAVKSEPPLPPPHSERQNDEDFFWNLNPDTTAWEALLHHESAQAHPTQPPKEQEQVKEQAQEQLKAQQERNTNTPPYHPPPPYDHHHCSCRDPQRHSIIIPFEAVRRGSILHDSWLLDQFIVDVFEYDPTWKATCGKVLSMEEQSEVWRWYLGVVERGFGVVVEEEGKGFERV